MSNQSTKAKSTKRETSRNLVSGSALVKCVERMGAKEQSAASDRFTERLTQNLDFNGSLKLSELHGHLRLISKKMAVGHPNKTELQEVCSQLDGAYDRVHKAIVLNISQSFDGSVAQPRFPLPSNQENPLKLEISSYQNFYQAQQSEMSAKIQGLRRYLRDTLAKQTIQSAQLAFIDQTLEETIGLPLRTGFGASVLMINASLERLTKLGDDEQKKQGINELHPQIRQLLMAELDLRLQPIKGLLDAFKLEVEQLND